MSLFYELIQVAVGQRESVSRVPCADEWLALFKMAQKQALLGICFAALERLPYDVTANVPLKVKLKWFAITEQIKKRNQIVSQRACELQQKLEADGFRICILKGQGVALLYHDLGNLRQSGDIDVWVDGSRDKTIQLLRKHYKCGRAVVHHIDVELFDDVSVEVHFIPSYAYSIPRYNVYKRFFEVSKDECFSHSGSGFSVPTVRFNLVYMLMHIYRHLFHEGIGLRQLMDYYFVLRSASEEKHIDNGSNASHEWAMYWLKRMGLERFTGAVMYVEHEVFGLHEKFMLCKSDETAGRFLLTEILRAGNFGQYDSRIIDAHSGNDVTIYLKSLSRIFSMIRFYPSEVLWAPMWKAGHFLWRKVKGY